MILYCWDHFESSFLQFSVNKLVIIFKLAEPIFLTSFWPSLWFNDIDPYFSGDFEWNYIKFLENLSSLLSISWSFFRKTNFLCAVEWDRLVTKIRIQLSELFYYFLIKYLLSSDSLNFIAFFRNLSYRLKLKGIFFTEVLLSFSAICENIFLSYLKLTTIKLHSLWRVKVEMYVYKIQINIC